ncbi:MAG: stage II sporulation protein P [Clostridia bacterium]|nr:stage II sporulation protein P [Clostridia bacterium]
MIKKTIAFVLLMITILFCIGPYDAHADDWFEDGYGYYTVYKDDGKVLFMIASQVSVGDEYISGDNKSYEIYKVDDNQKEAYAKYIEDIKLPEIDLDEILPSAAQKKGTVVLYCTHSDESYVPTDGTESKEHKGGIFEVARSLKKGFENNGVDAILDETVHTPHDAGAYRRSRRTVANLLKNKPDAIFDVHRDAVPKEAYVKDIEGMPATKVRLVIGRRNQNSNANKQVALKIKSVSDKMYPGLVKDIYMGEGNYNQEIAPRALLLEMGTYSHKRERAEKSAEMFADVATAALFGGTTKRAETKEKPGVDREEDISAITKSSKGATSGIFWVILILVVGGGLFLFLSSGRKEFRSKISKMTKEEFANFLGRRKNPKE